MLVTTPRTRPQLQPNVAFLLICSLIPAKPRYYRQAKSPLRAKPAQHLPNSASSAYRGPRLARRQALLIGWSAGTEEEASESCGLDDRNLFTSPPATVTLEFEDGRAPCCSQSLRMRGHDANTDEKLACRCRHQLSRR